MAENASSPEWLPTGWTTAVKTSKNGNKYKCYSDPSNKFKFHSKPEVLRYLNSIECNIPLKPEDENDEFGNAKSLEKGKDTVKRSEKNFVVEKAVAEELPPGWIKEVKVTQRGNNIRRDSYYTDPASGYVFLSLKDSKRYLKTGVLGKHAYKPKDKEHISVDAGDDNLSSPGADQGQELRDGGTDGQITENNKEMLGPAIMENHTYLEKQNSDQCRDVAMSSLNPRNTRNLEQREGKRESGLQIVSSPIVEDSPKKLLQNRVEFDKTNDVHPRINKSNAKKSSNLPRRASKRLAGVDLDPVPEVKTNSRTRRLTARQLGEATSSSSRKIDALPTPEEHPETLELETIAREQQVMSVVLPAADFSSSEKPAGEEKPLEASKEQAREEENSPNNKEQAVEEEAQLIPEERSIEKEPAYDNDMTLESPTNFSLADMWEDPCIEFAIKTLTGDIPIGEENKAEDTSGSSAEMSLKDLWMDPCIEFAVKTLTGAIPLDEDLDIRNIFQQQTSTSETQAGGIVLPTVDSFCQTEYTSKHFAAVEKPQNKQQVQETSRLPHTSARSLHNSGGNILRQQMEDRNRP